MALNYNLSKVYALSNNDTDFVKQTIELFMVEVPQNLKQIKIAIKTKNHQQANFYIHKIKPTFDLLGMIMAHDEILIVENWTVAAGKKKEIAATFKSIEKHVEKAIKEIKKNFG